jgi:hypothetical protein
MRCVLEGGKKKNILTLKHINNEIKGITHWRGLCFVLACGGAAAQRLEKTSK